MSAFLRRLRGLAGLAVSAAVIWGAIGLLIGAGILIFDPSSFDPGESALKLGYYFARSGLAAGAVAGLVLALAERRKSAATVRLPRLTIWGALGGLAIPFIAAGPQAMLPLFAVLGAGTGALTWALARRGERLAIGDRSSSRRQIESHAG